VNFNGEKTIQLVVLPIKSKKTDRNKNAPKQMMMMADIKDNK
jgi:hypothetical protein